MCERKCVFCRALISWSQKQYQPLNSWWQRPPFWIWTAFGYGFQSLFSPTFFMRLDHSAILIFFTANGIFCKYGTPKLIFLCLSYIWIVSWSAQLKQPSSCLMLHLQCCQLWNINYSENDKYSWTQKSTVFAAFWLLCKIHKLTELITLCYAFVGIANKKCILAWKV